MIDPRGPRFAATITTVVLAGVLVTGSAWLLAAQVLVFAIGASAGPAHAPYGLFFARVVRPRLDPPAELEHEAPPRFAQLVGLLFGLVGLVGLVGGLDLLAYVAVGAAVAAAFLNAAFDFCLGCEVYVILTRLTTGGETSVGTPAGRSASAHGGHSAPTRPGLSASIHPLNTEVRS